MQKCSYLFTLFVFLFACPVFAQHQKAMSSVSGVVVDSLKKTPVSYAAVSLYEKGKTEAAGGNLTSDNGTFAVDGLAPGSYFIKIDYVGYKTKVIENVTLKPGDNDLGKLQLADAAKMLKEASITASKSFIENKIDKMVFNVGNDVTSAGGTATDVLQKVPQVTVDINGNVELLGNSNIKVLLNGKPSTQFDNNLAEALRVIPASQIDKIEVITSPGAQYDAEGTGGIINIILKESKVRGINGNVNLTAGTRAENASAYLHAQNGNISYNFSVGGNAAIPGPTPGSMSRKADSAGILISDLEQHNSGYSQRHGYRAQYSTDWDITKKDHFSVSLSVFDHEYGSASNSSQSLTNYQGIPTNAATTRYSGSADGFQSYDLSLSYKKEYKKEGQELNFYLRPSWVNDNSDFSQSQWVYGAGSPFAGAHGSSRLKVLEAYASTDYAYPFTKDITFNTGLKGTFSRINAYSDHYSLDAASRDYIIDPSFIDNYDYSRDVYAAYASISLPLGNNFSMKAGLRDEYTLFHKMKPSDSLTPSYNTPCPSIVISKKLPHDQTIKFSYSYRLQRPGWWVLNPFINATDPLNLSEGNPNLAPEKVDNFELSWFRSFPKGSSLMATLYCRYSTQDQQSYYKLLDSFKIGDTLYRNVSLSSEVNAGTQTVAGLNLSGTLKLLNEKLELRGNVIFFNKNIVSTLDSGKTSNTWNYRTSINISYKFSPTLMAEGFENFRSASTEIQGKFPSYYSYSLAIRKIFWDTKGSLAFTTTDAFTPYLDQITNIAGQNFTLYTKQSLPLQSFGISFTYKFGKMEYTNENEGTGDEGN